jgi:hypothetical protein
MDYFDYESVAREARLSDEQIAAVKQAIRQEYPHDDMLWELHVLRACAAIRDGHVTLDEVTRRLAA